MAQDTKTLTCKDAAGCNRDVYARGLCKSHYERQRLAQERRPAQGSREEMAEAVEYSKGLVPSWGEGPPDPRLVPSAEATARAADVPARMLAERRRIRMVQIDGHKKIITAWRANGYRYVLVVLDGKTTAHRATGPCVRAAIIATIERSALLSPANTIIERWRCPTCIRRVDRAAS